MKKLILIAVVLLGAGLFTSCEKEDIVPAIDQINEIALASDKVSIDPSELPSEVTTYVAANYFETYIESAARVAGKGHEVGLGSGESLFFNEENELLGHEDCDGRRGGRGGDRDGHDHDHDHDHDNDRERTDIDPANLPTAVTDYLTANYPDATIERAKQIEDDGEQFFAVKLSNDTFVLFDADGNFLEAFTKDDRDHDHDGTSIDPADLPTAITDYVTANYPDATIERAKQVEKEEGQFFLVKLSTRTLLIFDADGNFVEDITKEDKEDDEEEDGEDNHIEISDLPTAITEYITANYPDAEARRAKLTEEGYFVMLTGHILLSFDLDGNFVEETTFVKPHCDKGGSIIAPEDLPAAITDYITTNFPSAEIRKAFLKNTEEGDRYVVGLSNDGERVILIFDVEGNFITQRP